MKNYQIGIENDFGKYNVFNIDIAILNGLYVTYDWNKVNDNCKTFKIQINETQKVKTSKRDKILILTIKRDAQNQIQFLVGHDLNLKELQLLPQKILHKEFKKIIKEAFKLTKTKRIEDLLTNPPFRNILNQND